MFSYFQGILLLFLCLGTAFANEPEFRFRLQADPETLDWTSAHSNYETHLLMNLMEGLVELDSKLEPIPALAEKWEISNDGLTYTFTLKKNALWSDGVALKAQDFVTSWKRLLSPKNSNEYTSFLFDIKNAEAFHKGSLKRFDDVGVRALDPMHLQVQLRRVVPHFLSLLSFWVTFPQREDFKNLSTMALSNKLVTLGPYVLTSWKKSQEIVLERNSKYHGTAAKVGRIRAIIEPDESKARKLLQENKIDVLLEVSTQDALAYASDPSKGFQLKYFNYLATGYLAFQTQKAPVSLLKVRQALARGIDRQAIGAALQGGQMPAESLIPKSLTGFEASAPAFDSTQAKELLKQAGFPEIAKMPVFKIIARKGAQEDAARFVQTQLSKNLGLRVDVLGVDPKDFKKVLKAGNFHAYVGHWGADYPDASSFMEILLSTSNNNYTGWKLARYDDAVNAAGGTLKVLDRLKFYSEAQKIVFQTETVMVPLYHPKITALVHQRVAGFEINALNYLFLKNVQVQ